jgi:LmbE family N-acetylglucosaminyl deacetylase
LSSDTRLLVIAPHPDDEVLGAGGLMQLARDAGGAVRVVYLTDGDGFTQGVAMESRRLSIADFREYGRRRRIEARSALAALGINDSAAVFLSFPDQGLCKLLRTYWSDQRAAYRSPYTRLDRPPSSGMLVPQTEYRGEDLTQELATVIDTFRPTIIAVPRKEDQHPDHSAAWFFFAEALGDVARDDPGFAPDVLTYVVHFNDWPFEVNAAALYPPPGLASGASGWVRVPLTPSQTRAKRAALRRYRTQVHAMGWFLEGFVRSNEIFSRPSSTHVVLPLKYSPCW